jgi:hypothetical protein
VLVTIVGACSNFVCATCPAIATGEARPLLLEHHNSDGTTATGHLPVAIEGYGPLVHRCIVVVIASTLFLLVFSVALGGISLLGEVNLCVLN